MTLAITTKEVVGETTHNAVLLDATQSADAQVTVASGVFRIAGTEYTLPSSATYTLAQQPSEQIVTGYLVRNTSTDVIEVLVDEVIRDGTDAAYKFEDRSYELLHRLFVLEVPAGVSNLNSSVMSVYHIVDEGGA